MKIILKLIYIRIYRLLIDIGLIRSKRFDVNGKTVLFHNLKDNNLLKNITINGFESHETEVIKLIKNYFCSLDFFYDIGSNVGHYSVITNLYHKEAQVYAVEPFPLNAKYIKDLRDNNKLSFSIVQKAVDVLDNKVKTFYFPISNTSSKLPGTGTLINTFKGSGGIFDDLSFDTTEVETVTLDSLMDSCDHDKTALVKIDCEGNEFNILNNSDVLNRENVDFIIELMINDDDKNDVFNIMKDHGYNGFLITNAGLIYEDRALTLPKPDRTNRTLWRNHFFTKKSVLEMKVFSIETYGYWI